MTEKTYLGVDHIVVRTRDTQIFDLLSGSLNLPVTWPLQKSAFATFAWVGIGNTNLEIWAATDNSDLPGDCQLPCIQQIAFAPANLAQSVARLEVAGLQCKPPRSFKSKNEQGDMHTNFTNAVILDLSSEACCVFFCDWDPHAPIVPWSKGLTTLERRQSGQEALSACGGGAIGVVGLRQIALQTQSLDISVEAWRALTQSQALPMLLTQDIELHLSAGPRDAISSLTFAVSDLPTAERVLQSNGLLDVLTDGSTALARVATGGVTLRFIQG